MKKIKHPKIPPNCPYFCKTKKGDAFLISHAGPHNRPLLIVLMETPAKYMRPVIGAVAEAYWLMEAKAQTSFKLPDRLPRKKVFKEISDGEWRVFYEMDCDAEAVRWREWWTKNLPNI